MVKTKDINQVYNRFKDLENRIISIRDLLKSDKISPGRRNSLLRESEIAQTKAIELINKTINSIDGFITIINYTVRSPDDEPCTVTKVAIGSAEYVESVLRLAILVNPGHTLEVHSVREHNTKEPWTT